MKLAEWAELSVRRCSLLDGTLKNGVFIVKADYLLELDLILSVKKLMRYTKSLVQLDAGLPHDQKYWFIPTGLFEVFFEKYSNLYIQTVDRGTSINLLVSVEDGKLRMRWFYGKK